MPRRYSIEKEGTLKPDEYSNRPKTQGALGSLRLMGIPVRLHFTFVLLLMFVIFTGLGGTQSLASYTVSIVALFASVLAHEMAHAWLASRCGMRTLEIVMYPIGGVSRMENTPKPWQEFWIALAGPAMNLLIATGLVAVAYYRHLLFPPLDLWARPTNANLLERIALANVVLAAFNLIPAYPMDGGRMLRAALTRWRGENEATRIAAWAGRMLAISMGFYGLFSAPLLVFVAFFVYLGAAQESAAALGRTLTQGIPVRAAMVSEFHTLTHGSTIRDAANLLLATSQQDFPVVHGSEVLGLLGRGALLRAMATEGPDAYVAGVMDREFPRISPDVDLSEVLPLMARSGACALVMKDEQLQGLLTTENLSQFLLLRRFGMNPNVLAYDGHRVD